MWDTRKLWYLSTPLSRFQCVGVSGATPLFPPVIGAPGYRTQNSFSESMDLSELSDDTACGEAHQVECSPEHAGRTLVSLCATLHIGTKPPSLSF